MIPDTHCAGCGQAILKQFVEHHSYPRKKWHPECYMIQKVLQLNVYIYFSNHPLTQQLLVLEYTTCGCNGRDTAGWYDISLLIEWCHYSYVDHCFLFIYAQTLDPRSLTADRLRELQNTMETKVIRIWTDLSAFQESSATCISDMLFHIAAGAYMESMRMASQFILHLEVLFAALDTIGSISAEKGEGKFIMDTSPVMRNWA